MTATLEPTITTNDPQPIFSAQVCSEAEAVFEVSLLLKGAAAQFQLTADATRTLLDLPIPERPKSVLPDVIETDVTPEDIAKGVLGSVANCPLARAINRVLPSGWRARVGGGVVRITHLRREHPQMEYANSHEGYHFVAEFDAGQTPAPFHLVLKRMR